MTFKDIRRKLIDFDLNQTELYDLIKDNVSCSYSTFNSYLTGRYPLPSDVEEEIITVFKTIEEKRSASILRGK